MLDLFANQRRGSNLAAPRWFPFRTRIAAVANGRIGFRGNDAGGFQIEGGMTPEGQFARPAFMPIAKTPACQPRRMTDEGKAADGSFRRFERAGLERAQRMRAGLLLLPAPRWRARGCYRGCSREGKGRLMEDEGVDLATERIEAEAARPVAERKARIAIHDYLQAARGRRDAAHTEIAVARLLAVCWKFKLGCRKFTDRRAVRPFC
jgi:hypothetical protein